jgi:YYY domain-containing protein
MGEALLSAITWYVAISIVAVLTYPITFHVFRVLPDRGFSISRPLGLVAVAFPIWWIGHLAPLPLTRVSIVIIAIGVGAASWLLTSPRETIRPFFAANRRRLLILETITALLFFGYVIVRGFNPDISGTEKPMELAFLNSAIVADRLPVPDPWFAGEAINYYYLGYVVLGMIAKVTGISGGVAFNLGLASTFALATVGAAGLAGNIAESFQIRSRKVPVFSALLGGFLLMFGGNLYAAAELIRSPGETVRAGWWDGVGWGGSRVIEEGGFPDGGTRTVITEFPAFSWILGDLHPHVLAYPWLIMAMALVFNLFATLRSNVTVRSLIIPSVALGASFAVLHSANTWDVPIIALLTLIALASVALAHDWRAPSIAATIAALSALVTALPFGLHYTSAAGDLQQEVGGISNAPLIGSIISTAGYVYWDRTSAGELLLVHGGFLLLTVIAIATFWSDRAVDLRPPGSLLLAVVALLVLIGALTSVPALFLIGIPLALVAWFLSRRDLDTGAVFAFLLAAVAFGAVLVTEFLYVRDPFGDRMNTVFKIYFQVWAFMAIALAALVPHAITRIQELAGRGTSAATSALLGLILVAMSVYAPLSAYRWYQEFSDWRGVDGLAYLEEVHPGEAGAIDWIRENTGPSSVILEAPGCSYGSDRGIPHSRMSMATGVPTVIGWDGHQFQWRRQQPELAAQISRRIDHVSTMFDAPESPEAREYREEYGVTHIVVGILETEGYTRCGHGPPYTQAGLAAIERIGWDLAYARGGVSVYVRPDLVDTN